MIWMDYNIMSYGDGSFRVLGDTDTEVMDKGLYKPGDVFVVTESGILRKSDQLSVLMMKYKEGKNNDTRVSQRD